MQSIVGRYIIKQANSPDMTSNIRAVRWFIEVVKKAVRYSNLFPTTTNTIENIIVESGLK
ncbi:MAG: hypothetical protein WBM69_03775 [Desulfobacterales bacterium]